MRRTISAPKRCAGRLQCGIGSGITHWCPQRRFLRRRLPKFSDNRAKKLPLCAAWCFYSQNTPCVRCTHLHTYAWICKHVVGSIPTAAFARNWNGCPSELSLNSNASSPVHFLTSIPNCFVPNPAPGQSAFSTEHPQTLMPPYQKMSSWVHATV
jgi:hypothetical protein